MLTCLTSLKPGFKSEDTLKGTDFARCMFCLCQKCSRHIVNNYPTLGCGGQRAQCFLDKLCCPQTMSTEVGTEFTGPLWNVSNIWIQCHDALYLPGTGWSLRASYFSAVPIDDVIVHEVVVYLFKVWSWLVAEIKHSLGLHGSRNWPNWNSKGIKKILTPKIVK